MVYPDAFLVAPVSAMLYCSRLVVGWPLYVFLVLLIFSKVYKLSSLYITVMLLIGYPNRQKPCGSPNFLPLEFLFR